jgi:hypothetical protein
VLQTVLSAVILMPLFACSPIQTIPPAKSTLVGSRVSSRFKGSEYEAKVASGGIALTSSGSTTFSGVIRGRQVIKRVEQDQCSRLLSVGRLSASTNVKVLDYDSDERSYLVDGDVEVLQQNTLFVCPGSIIENASLSGKSVSFMSPSWQPVEIPFGGVVQVTEDGNVRRLRMNPSHQ